MQEDMLSQVGRIIRLLTLLAAGLAAAPAYAQGINIDEGKTPAQMFASDCSVCHKAPRGLAKSANARAVTDFLRQHYTSSREQAAAMAGFLLAAGTDPRGPAQRDQATTSRSKPGERTSRAADDADATTDSRARRGRRGSQPTRAAEDGIIAEEPIPRPPRGVPDRSKRQATTGTATDAPDTGPGATPVRRASPGAPTAAQAEGPAESEAAVTPSKTADAPVASATSIDAILSGAATPSTEPSADRPVPPRTDDIPD
jgi:hypothetical protein